MNRKRIRGLVSPMLAFSLVAMAFAGCGELTGPTSPSTPTSVAATLLAGGTSVKVSWTPSPQNDGVVSYNVFRNGTKVGEAKTTSYTDTGLAQQLTYRYTVSANCTSGVISDASAESVAATVTTLDVTPPTVTQHQPPTGFQGVSSGATATVVFSEPMDPTTINTTTFNLKVSATGVLIPGTVTFTPATRTAEFKPTNPMPNPQNITATVTTGAKDLAGNRLAADFAWGFTTADQSPPTVLSTTPANGETAPPSVIFFVSFSEAMDASTITAANITLKVTSSGTAVSGNVNYNTTTHNASFTPNQTLAQNTGYTLTISGAVKDAAGNQMGTAVTVAITTADVTPPTVVSTIPNDGAIGISPTAAITATFSEPMSQATISATSFTLKTTSGLTPVTGTVTYSTANNTATFTPSSSLSSTTSYTANITTDARDVSGNALAAPKVWTFTTSDVVPPTVVSVSPGNLATGVAATATVEVTFSEPMAAGTITASTITLKNTLTSAPIAASVSYNTTTKVATLTPNASLSGGTQYTVTVTTGVTDEAGNPLASPFPSTFTTAVIDATPPTVSAVAPTNDQMDIATNTTVRVTFSEPMAALTISGTTISLKNTATSAPIAATVVYNPATNIATLTPTSALTIGTQYTVTVTTGVTDLAGNPMAAPFISTFTTLPPPDTTAPTVSSVSPANGAPSVATNTNVQVTFSEAMDPLSITTTTVSLKNTSTSAVVPTTVSYNPSTNVATLTLNPGPLSNSTNYTVVVTTGVRDVSLNPMAAQFTSTFTTVPIPDTTAPTIITRNPAQGAIGIATNTTVNVQFSEPMDQSSINSNTLKVTDSLGAVVAGSLTYDGPTNTARFTPTSALNNNAVYTLTVTIGVKDVSGNPLALQAVSTFTTVLDTTKPTIIANSPADGTTAPTTTVVTVTFSEAMNVTTINGTNFKLTPTLGGPPLAGTVSYNTTSHVATFTASAPGFIASTNYTATVTTGVKDLAGNQMAGSFVFTFTAVP